jgi:hypothetical protein
VCSFVGVLAADGESVGDVRSEFFGETDSTWLADRYSALLLYNTHCCQP